MLSASLITLAIYLFVTGMGWGITCFILPQDTRLYQLWLAPWFGLIVIDISVVWLSRLGLGTNQSVYIIAALGLSLLILGKLCKCQIQVSLTRLDGIFALGTVIALFLALYPMVAIDQAPTTISLGNGDPVDYGLVGDFLKSHSIAQLPKLNPDYPITFRISDLLAPGVRPGTWLVLALFASLVHQQTYQVFSIALAIFFALTPALISIFTLEATKSQWAGLITLGMSVFNINLLYFNYHGFAAQILGQGCLIIAFLLIYLSEDKVKGNLRNYIIPLGLTVSSLFTLYPEITPFLIIPSFFYFAFKLIINCRNPLNLLKKLGLISVVTVLIDPFGFWYGFRYAWLASSQPVGWSMPRWAWPIDMVGLLNIHSDTTQSFWLFIVSLPVIGLLALGIIRLKNKPFWVAILVVTLGVLVWLRLFRQYSYGYYKTIGFLSFFIIITFASGLMAFMGEYMPRKFKQQRFEYLFIGVVLLLNALAVLPTFKQISVNHLSVTPELVELSAISKWVKDKKVFVELNHHWDESWATIFLNQADIRTGLVNQDRGTRFFGANYLFSKVEKGGLYVAQNWHDGFIDTDELVWSNAVYSLINPSSSKPKDKNINIQLGENWWSLEKWMVEPSESKAFRWMKQDAVIEVENRFTQPTTAKLRIKFIPLLPKTTIDVYLNKSILDTITIAGTPKNYSVYFCLSQGYNKIRFHVREGTKKSPGDYREIALGVNFIRLEELEEADIRHN